MKIVDADYVNDPEISNFLYHLRTCVPTHTSEDDDFLRDSFKDTEFYYFSSKVYPAKLVIRMCISFVTKLASYSPGREQVIEKIFFASMPLAIWSETPTSSDRTLIWGNGGVTLTAEDDLILFMDTELSQKLQHDKDGDLSVE